MIVTKFLPKFQSKNLSGQVSFPELEVGISQYSTCHERSITESRLLGLLIADSETAEMPCDQSLLLYVFLRSSFCIEAVQKRAKEMTKIAAFKKMSYKRMVKLKLYVKSGAGT